MLFDRVLRPALYRFGRGDPETVHAHTMRVLTRLSSAGPVLDACRRRYAVDDPVTVFGVRFANRVGLAAGLDKDGMALPAWPALGFGFVEVGTVTRHPQQGNPRPRLVQLPHSAALINRMGFNNAGSTALADRLSATGPLPVPLGVSIGKSKSTPLSDAVADYLTSLRMLAGHADYFAVNVSSPNTPGLRRLQDRGWLTELLTALRSESATAGQQHGKGRIPLLVKVSPELTDDAVDDLVDVALSCGVDGIVATNTTLARDGVHPDDVPTARQAGGLSGAPLGPRARAVVRRLHDHGGGAVPIIGVGGIGGADDARRMLDSGATLLQLYTSFVYSGPAVVRAVAAAARG